MIDWEEVSFLSIIASGLMVVAICVQKVYNYWDVLK